MSRTVAVVQARMGSTRLPGKCLVDICGKPMLQHVLERLRRSQRIDEVVVATTVNPGDEPIVNLTQRLGLRAFRGSEDDVLSRYLDAGRGARADIIARVTSDCPLIDPGLCDDVIAAYRDKNGDFASNVLDRTYPRGVETEVFSLAALERIDTLTTQTFEREHVAPYFYTHPEQFALVSVTTDGELRRPDLRLCVDTQEDLQLVRHVFERLKDRGNAFSMLDAVRVIDQEPWLATLNSAVAQKELGE